MRTETDTVTGAAPTRAAGASLREGLRGRAPVSRRAVAGIALALCLVGAGVGGYLIGNSSDVDLAAVRSDAAAEGREAGAQSGAEEGFSEGFRAARERAYAPVYRAAYKRAYAAEFESRGLEPPGRIRVRGPQ
jgi:hypothetical protein